MGGQRRGYEDQMASAMQTQARIGEEQWGMYKQYLPGLLQSAYSNIPADFGKEFSREAFQAKEGQMREDWARAQGANEQALEQQLRQGGSNLAQTNPAAYARIKAQQRSGMASQLQQAVTNQRTQYAMMGAQQAMDLANLVRGGATGAGQFGMSAFGNQAQMLQYLMGQQGGDPYGNAMGGAMTGAAAGSKISPGWGTVIGGLLGAYAGYNS